MSEEMAGVNGPEAASTGLDVAATGRALGLSSTSARIAQLHHVDEAVRHKGR